MVVWDPDVDVEGDVANSEIFMFTVDGTDFKTWEPKHPRYNIDTKYASHKFKSAGYRYEIVISMMTGKVVWVYGPHRGGEHDLVILRKKLYQMFRIGQSYICDKAYGSERINESCLLTPNTLDAQEVAKLKAIACCRHETFNG